jgi:hypothetical protein
LSRPDSPAGISIDDYAGIDYAGRKVQNHKEAWKIETIEKFFWGALSIVLSFIPSYILIGLVHLLTPHGFWQWLVMVLLLGVPLIGIQILAVIVLVLVLWYISVM